MALNLPDEHFWHQGRRWHRVPEKPYERWLTGIDLGQSQDYTAIAVMHHMRTPLDEWEPNDATGKLWQRVEERFEVPFLQRLPLGMPYPAQIMRMQQVLAGLCQHDVDVCLDQTGCGAPVGDLVEAAGLKPIRITFTSGHKPTGAGRKWGVPKAIIVSGIDAKLHCGELRFAKELLEAETLKDELINFQRHVSQTGRLLFEHRAGRHDDLVFSIGIALWWAIKRPRHRYHVGFAKGLCS